MTNRVAFFSPFPHGKIKEATIAFLCIGAVRKPSIVGGRITMRPYTNAPVSPSPWEMGLGGEVV